jgi:hypothetical protein
VHIAFVAKEAVMMEKTWEKETITDVVNLALGAWLFLMPWIFGFVAETAASWNAWLSGLVIGALAVAALVAFAEWEEWINLVLGLWVAVSPWIVGSVGQATTTIHVLVGIAVAVVAAVRLGFVHRTPPRVTAGCRSPRAALRRPAASGKLPARTGWMAESIKRILESLIMPDHIHSPAGAASAARTASKERAAIGAGDYPFADLELDERNLLGVFARYGRDGRAIPIISLMVLAGLQGERQRLLRTLRRLVARGLIKQAGGDPFVGSPVAYRLARRVPRREASAP